LTTYYLDTSALAKRYITELGSGWVKTLADATAGNAIVISYLTTVELISTLARREREGTLTPLDTHLLQIRFLADFERTYLTIPLEMPVLKHARDLVSRHPLRSLDAIQLASALEATTILDEPMTFISADKNLLAVAVSEDFATDNPNDHA
jgi:predicted nucleic acid-binding protein